MQLHHNAVLIFYFVDYTILWYSIFVAFVNSCKFLEQNINCETKLCIFYESWIQRWILENLDEGRLLVVLLIKSIH